MKFTVEIEEFWLEDEDIESTLKGYVIREVVGQINKQLEKKIEDQISRTVKDQIEKEFTLKLRKKVDEFMAEGKVKGQYGNDMISLEEWIKAEFVKTSGWNSPKEKLDQLAKQFGKEMKDRYDLLFASQIVTKLNEQGLLREDVAKILLSDGKKDAS